MTDPVATDSATSPARIVQAVPWLACADLRAALDFFETRLGFVKEWTWGEPARDGGVQRDGVRLYLVQKAVAPHVGVAGLEISILVRDVAALYAEHQARGAPITQSLRDEPWGAREYHVAEPNGYVLRFVGEP